MRVIGEERNRGEERREEGGLDCAVLGLSRCLSATLLIDPTKTRAQLRHRVKLHTTPSVRAQLRQ
jgi:hypothetical protein